MNNNKICFALLLLSIINLAHGITFHAKDFKDHQAFANQFPAVGVVTVSIDINGAGGIGTGVLIAPDKVLTAAHVVTDESTGITKSDIVFKLATNDVNLKSGRLGHKTIREIRVSSVEYGDYWGDTNPPEADLAILTLSEPVHDIEPMKISKNIPDSFSEGIMVGWGTHYIVGIGCMKKSDKRLAKAGKLRWAAKNIIENEGDGILRVDMDPLPGHADLVGSPANEVGNEGSVYLEGIVNKGDSGGPLLVETEQGEFHIVGIAIRSKGLFDEEIKCSPYGVRPQWVSLSSSFSREFLERSGIIAANDEFRKK